MNAESFVRPPSLLLVNLDNVILLHLQRFWSLVIIDPAAVEEKTEKENVLILSKFKANAVVNILLGLN